MSNAKAYDAAMANYSDAIEEQQFEYQKAARRGDADAMARAGQEIAALRVQVKEFNALAHEHVSSMQTIPGGDNLSRNDSNLCRQYGISPDVLGVAKSWTSDPRVSDKERVETYLRNKQKLQQMRQTGEYRDDQGTVSR